MRKFGTMRKVDDLGRVVIPKDIRNKLNIPVGTRLEVYATEDGKVVMEKIDNGCVICGASEVTLVECNNIFLCTDCVDDLLDKFVGVAKDL